VAAVTIGNGVDEEYVSPLVLSTKPIVSSVTIAQL
jgi:hypothetical protein